jgi:transketolase C-terminal domain/subunit
MEAILKEVFQDPGLRFIFSTRSSTPFILNDNGEPFFTAGYRFVAGRDEVIRGGESGYIVSYGEMLYRCLDAVERLRRQGIRVGLINKPTLNVVDEEMMEKIAGTGFVLVVETQNIKTGLGARFGTWLLERGSTAAYVRMGLTREGHGGLQEQIAHQGLESNDIQNKILELLPVKTDKRH